MLRNILASMQSYARHSRVPRVVSNAASFNMTDAANPYQSNAACFHTSNAAQQGTSTAVDQHQWRWSPWGPYPCHPEPSSQGSKRRRTESQPSDSDGTKMTLTLTSWRVSVGTSLVTLSLTQIRIQSRMSPRQEEMCSYKGQAQILELSSGEAIEKWEAEGTSQQVPTTILLSSPPTKAGWINRLLDPKDS